MHCIAHARRYFDQAVENDKVRAEYVLHEIQNFMRLSVSERKYARTQRATRN
ncbi:MAG: hypothetical protein IPK08_04025 [Bacteroidetes bacterium]|nr:hypothetical protein [Bacteroidota bacterium]